MITAGGIRLSVTSQPDSLITNAAKDLLVYQSEPLALAFPSGDGGAITMNPLAHVTQTLFLQRPGHARAKTITATPNCTLHPPRSSANVNARTHRNLIRASKQYPQILLDVHTCPLASCELGRKQTENRRHICIYVYTHTSM